MTFFIVGVVDFSAWSKGGWGLRKAVHIPTGFWKPWKPQDTIVKTTMISSDTVDTGLNHQEE